MTSSIGPPRSHGTFFAASRSVRGPTECNDFREIFTKGISEKYSLCEPEKPSRDMFRETFTFSQPNFYGFRNPNKQR